LSKSNRRSTNTGTRGTSRTAPKPASPPAPAAATPDDDTIVIETPAAAAAGGASIAAATAASSGTRTTRSTRPASTSPTGTRRAGRREVARRRYDQPNFLERHRSALIGGVVVVAIALVAGWIFLSATSPAYACSSTFPADAPVASGQLGAVQPDMGNNHINAGTQVRYTYCPPASGPHINRSGFGPIEPRFYGQNDRSEPQGWVHNLEHGAVVVLYSCEQGACDPEDLAQLQSFLRGFDAVSPVCNVPPRTVGPVIARFDQMPKPYAALVWDRVLYMDTFDPALVKQFYLQEGEKLNADGTDFLAPPEPQCAVPSPSVSPSPSTSASPSVSPGTSASPSASPSPSASAAPSASDVASPSASPSPSAS
jgi:uncharacterized protein DUF3105